MKKAFLEANAITRFLDDNISGKEVQAILSSHDYTPVIGLHVVYELGILNVNPFGRSLEYADDKQLRQVIQASLNRGEQLQGLKRALAALGGNQFRGTSPDEMMQWNACADLLANCIVYYNAMIMSSFKTYCIETGNGKQLIHLRSISPASWEHILLNGYYDLADNDPHWDIEPAIRGLNLAA